MSAGSAPPFMFEIGTGVWLGGPGQEYQGLVDPGMVPPQEREAIAGHGIDTVWFMGVRERSPAGIAISIRNAGGCVEPGPWQCHLFQRGAS